MTDSAPASQLSATLSPMAMLASVLALGGAAQWLAWLLRVPSILILLTVGFLAGPVFGIVQPDQLFGDLLLPFVSVAVALILFEGGLTLNARELGGARGVVFMLVTVGAIVTGALATTAAYFLIPDLGFGLSLLLGCILTVTGPTVVLPLLREIRPTGPVNAILKWEGIVIDPIGAVFAVIAFEVVSQGRYDSLVADAIWIIARTLTFGTLVGLAGAALLAVAIRRFWLPDHLHTIAAAVVVVGVFAGSNALMQESGLMAVTAMGIALANQRYADMRHILEFKENLRVFLLSMVFVLLSARLSLSDFAEVGWSVAAFVIALIFLVRPATVFASTIGSRLSTRERIYLAWMAPRGIVAAAVTSVFSLALEEQGYENARLLAPIVFTVIVTTVLVYGLTGSMVARKLGLADPDPQGFLILGAGVLGREVGSGLQAAGVKVLLIDTNRENILAAQMAGLPTHFGSVLAEDTLEKIDLAGIGRLLAMTTNDEVNSLAVQRFSPAFGRARLYQTAPKGSESGQSKIGAEFHARLLFRHNATVASMTDLIEAGASVRPTKLTPEFTFEAFKARFGDSAIVMFVVQENGRVQVVTADAPVTPKPGQTVISLTPRVAKEAPAA
jgi:NhaP-type Na+/H+ or K+/H+ antiporter